MKTAVSIPAHLYRAADRAAAKLGVSRDRLYATALDDYLARLDVNDVTKRLNEVYADQDSTLDPVLARMQAVSVEEDNR